MHAIETARVLLRPLSSDDLDEFALLGSDPDVMRYIGPGKTQARDQAAARLCAIIDDRRKHGFGLWAAIDKADGAWMGFCGLQFLDSSSEVEVGYRLARRFWGMGLATEAASACLRYGFEELGLDRIVGVVQLENLASQRVLEKIGLRYVRNARFYNSDVKYYAITRNEFEPDDSTYIQRFE
jgi:RimJ/RimL family protein N-acetyltransferase